MSDRRDRDRPHERKDEPAPEWRAGWEDQELTTLEASLAATPAQRLEWLEEAIEIAWASGALPREDEG